MAMVIVGAQEIGMIIIVKGISALKIKENLARSTSSWGWSLPIVKIITI